MGRKLGGKLSEEQKLKISLALRGRSSTRIGFHHTEETKAKLRMFNLGNKRGLGYKHTCEAKQRMSISRMGHPVSAETKERISQSRKISPLCKGRNRPLESYQLQGLKLLGNKFGLGYRHTPEAKEKISLANIGNQRTLGYHHTGEARLKIGEASRQRWNTPSYRDIVVRNWIKAIHKRPTKPESKVLGAVTLLNLPFIYNGNRGDFIISGKCPDFINCNGKKAIIEVFGNYWHRRIEEIERKQLFGKYGFKTLILWGDHIRELSIEALAKEIETFSNSC